MMGGASVQQMADRVAGLMEERLRIRGAGLAAKLRRGGRALPRRIRAEAELLAAAAEKARVPKLLVQMDHERVAAAYDACLRYLAPLGRGARLRGYLLDLAAAAGFALVVTAALVLGVLVWRGYL
ncbi:hypothetical protein [Frigidibacter mobilis]|uniref:Uncharacterized protein n=1 Tax=Frigidibacter mobilis TaxID=1335048 RepID=A0A161GX22_9RHOB|nr:hypothetical protein [Frigidibacter mobilis]AMY70679.1 hypothetical protein AKL17_3454 [Frigidibacter mobilis]